MSDMFGLNSHDGGHDSFSDHGHGHEASLQSLVNK
jgi:hypothetical protein